MASFMARQAHVGKGKSARALHVRAVFLVKATILTATIVALVVLEPHLRNLFLWTVQHLNLKETIIWTGIAICIFLMVRITNREIRQSQEQDRQIDEMLRTEKLNFERRVSARTLESIAAEKARLRDLEQIAQFGKLSQGIFHDLMNPLSSVSLYMENLAATSPDDPKLIEGRAIISEAVEASRRMRTFMESVRASMNDSQTIAHSDLAQELAVVRNILAYQLRNAGVTLELDLDTHIKLPILAVRLQQIFLNLIGNAIQAFESSTTGASKYGELPTIRIEAQRKAESIEIRVLDNACGMPAEVVNKIFRESFTTKSTGTGIGLRTVRFIVEQDLKGKIECTSEEGEGSVFAITIPINEKTQGSDR